MLFRPELYTAQMPAVLDSFIRITGIDEWKRRTTWFAQQLGQNEFLTDYFQQIYSLELEFTRVMHELQTGCFEQRLTSVERYRLFAFMAVVTMVYERLTQHGRNRLRGMILGGLRDHGLTPLRQEMTVAAHLLFNGFDVSFSDIESGSGFDFLARKEDVEIEVECKRAGVSLGRKIPRFETLQLHKHIHAQVEPTFTSLRCGMFLRVILPQRLTLNEEQHKAIAATVGAAFRTGVAREEPHCRVELNTFEILGSPFEKPNEEAKRNMRAFIEKRFGTKNRELMILGGTAGTRALVISVESKQRDGVLDRLFEELSESVKNQFSKRRPGVLCVQFIDLTNEQIQRIDSASDGDDMPKRPSYLWRRTSDFLRSERRNHVLSIAFRGHGVVSRTSTAADRPKHHIQEEGNAFVVTNDGHPLAKDRRYSIFAADAEPPTRIVSGAV